MLRNSVFFSVALGLVLSLVGSGVAAAGPPGATIGVVGGSVFPTRFALPDGYLAKGITIGAWPSAFVVSGSDGSVDRVDLRTGLGKIISGPAGKQATGVKIDSCGRLFVAGGDGGDARVVDSRTGTILKDYQLSDQPGATATDVAVTANAAWFTDAFRAVLYKLPIGPGGSLPENVQTISISGEGYAAGNLTTGIAQTPDGRALIIAQVETGKFFRVDPDTGNAIQLDLGGQLFPGADGLLLQGNILYVAQMRLNTVNKIDLNSSGTTGRLESRTTDRRFDGTAEMAPFGNRLYVTNTREITVPNPTPQTPYEVVAIRKP